LITVLQRVRHLSWKCFGTTCIWWNP